MSRHATSAVLLGVCVLAWFAACGPPRATDDPIEAFRRGLADPEAHPLRDGLAVDVAALQAAVARFAEENGALVRARLEASVSDLGRAEPPSGPWYADIVTVSPDVLAAAAPTIRMLEVLDPDVRSVVRHTLVLALPDGLAARTSASAADTGAWLGFLAAATPTWRNCGAVARRMTICADYGGLDVFVVDLLRSGDLWSPAGVTWWQRQP